ncbi:hypothetical protein F5Y18DRAFT_413520 [Xylariaceae sp. FL1019]|nr:hypothetical protein F5Y18DRAFT_413520 [Xylariaceae sp. FL1019]
MPARHVSRPGGYQISLEEECGARVLLISKKSLPRDIQEKAAPEVLKWLDGFMTWCTTGDTIRWSDVRHFVGELNSKNAPLMWLLMRTDSRTAENMKKIIVETPYGTEPRERLEIVADNVHNPVVIRVSDYVYQRMTQYGVNVGFEVECVGPYAHSCAVDPKKPPEQLVTEQNYDNESSILTWTEKAPRQVFGGHSSSGNASGTAQYANFPYQAPAYQVDAGQSSSSNASGTAQYANHAYQTPAISYQVGAGQSSSLNPSGTAQYANLAYQTPAISYQVGAGQSSSSNPSGTVSYGNTGSPWGLAQSTHQYSNTRTGSYQNAYEARAGLVPAP